MRVASGQGFRGVSFERHLWAGLGLEIQVCGCASESSVTKSCASWDCESERSCVPKGCES